MLMVRMVFYILNVLILFNFCCVFFIIVLNGFIVFDSGIFVYVLFSVFIILFVVCIVFDEAVKVLLRFNVFVMALFVLAMPKFRKVLFTLFKIVNPLRKQILCQNK